jgi:hypothetical protein
MYSYHLHRKGILRVFNIRCDKSYVLQWHAARSDILHCLRTNDFVLKQHALLSVCFHDCILMRDFGTVFRQSVGFLGRGIGLSRGLYLHGTAQHRKTRRKVRASSGFGTHDPSFKAMKTHAVHSGANVVGVAPLWHGKLDNRHGDGNKVESRRDTKVINEQNLCADPRVMRGIVESAY